MGYQGRSPWLVSLRATDLVRVLMNDFEPALLCQPAQIERLGASDHCFRGKAVPQVYEASIQNDYPQVTEIRRVVQQTKVDHTGNCHRGEKRGSGQSARVLLRE